MHLPKEPIRVGPIHRPLLLRPGHFDRPFRTISLRLGTTPIRNRHVLACATSLHDELAWDYLTTPLATRPNVSTAWLNLAQSMRDQESVDLADRAYDAAWEAEPTNARILWDHAQMLDHAGRLEDARQRYQKLVDGEWQPRFRPLQGRAQRIMADAVN